MKNKPIRMFLFVDALGWKIAQDHHFLEDLLPYRQSVDMQFGYSSSAIPTILSGQTPAVHGHLGLFRFAPNHSPFKGIARWSWIFFWKNFWDRGRVRHHLSKLIKKLYGFTGYFQLYQMPIKKLSLMDYCEKQDLFVPHGMEQVPNLADVLEQTKLKYHISNWRLPDEQNYERAEQAIKEGAQFLFIYTASFDGLLHQAVGKDDIVQNKLDDISQHIRHLLQTAQNRDPQATLTVFSDHGMTPLSGTVTIKTAVDTSGLVFGQDYGACYDSTMARFHFLSQHGKDVIMRIIQDYGQQGHLLTQEEEQRYGIYRQDRMFGDAIFLLNPGLQIVPSDMGSKPLNGMHGFAPEDIHSKAAIFSTQPLPDSIHTVADYFTIMTEHIRTLNEAHENPHH